MVIADRFKSRPGAETVRLPSGGEMTLAVEHAAAILVNEQTAFRVVCTPELLPQLALGRLLTEGWITCADEVEQIAVCAEGLKVSVHLTHPLEAAAAAGQEVEPLADVAVHRHEHGVVAHDQRLDRGSHPARLGHGTSVVAPPSRRPLFVDGATYC